MNEGTSRGLVGFERGARRASLIFVAVILALGACAAVVHQRSPDFGGEDALHADAARNLLERGVYEFNGRPETTQPPGLALILASVFAVFGYGYGVSVVTMAVFETLGFLAAYEVMRRRAGTVIAGMICIVLMTSPAYFSWATRSVYASFPYFFTTMAALLCGERYDGAKTFRSRLAWGVALTLAVVASLLIATSTIALLGAIVMFVLATALTDRRLARTRLLKFLPILVAGVLVQSVWMHREQTAPEWPLPGYPASYLQQLQVKDGNHPEMGMASWTDMPDRLRRNLLAGTDALMQLLLRHGISESRVAVLMVPLLLVAAGWAYSVWTSAGADLVAWYFAGYTLIYLFWPWKVEVRFVLPIAPLACLYAWRAIAGLRLASQTRPRTAGTLWLILSLSMIVAGVRSILAPRRTSHGDLPDLLAIAMWLASAGGAIWMVRSGRTILSGKLFSRPPRWLRGAAARWPIGWHELGMRTAVVCVLGLVTLSIRTDARIARENLDRTSLTGAEHVGTGETLPSEVSAGIWLRSHTSPDAIVMARHWITVHHHSSRKVVWFPPISDADVLFEGIGKHAVDYIVVVKHAEPYYLPDDGDCFERLLTGHPAAFRLVMQTGDLRIFRVQRVAYAPVSAPAA